jgi:hypothetical protein
LLPAKLSGKKKQSYCKVMFVFVNYGNISQSKYIWLSCLLVNGFICKFLVELHWGVCIFVSCHVSYLSHAHSIHAYYVEKNITYITPQLVAAGVKLTLL